MAKVYDYVGLRAKVTMNPWKAKLVTRSINYIMFNCSVLSFSNEVVMTSKKHFEINFLNTEDLCHSLFNILNDVISIENLNVYLTFHMGMRLQSISRNFFNFMLTLNNYHEVLSLSKTQHCRQEMCLAKLAFCHSGE